MSLVKCVDCRLDLDSRVIVKAAFCCPLFGKVRDATPRECRSFVPTLAAAALAAAERSHQEQRAALKIQNRVMP